MIIGNKRFDTSRKHLYIMGILNITPDSFSDGGRYETLDKSLAHVEEMIRDGADIIDIGAESTRPGYKQISADEEIEKLCRTIEAVKARFDIPISVDTYKSPVMEQCLKAGAGLANDIWGFRYKEGDMAQVVAKYDVPVVLMHNDDYGRSLEERTPEMLEHYPEGKVTDRVIDGLRISVDKALKAGVKPENIILDPGIGFAKTQRENLITMKDIGRITESLDYPMLLATSRKSMIGNVLELGTDEREEGTLVTTVMAAEAGCCFVRVHDVKKNARAIKMYEAIREA